MRRSFAALLGLGLPLLSALAMAEGRIQGQVSNALDKSLLPGASLSLYQGETGKLVALALSEPDGSYRFEGVAAGPYDIRATASQFKPFMREKLQVRDERTLRVNLDLLPEDLSKY